MIKQLDKKMKTCMTCKDRPCAQEQKAWSTINPTGKICHTTQLPAQWVGTYLPRVSMKNSLS